jgi:hypothetical protein
MFGVITGTAVGALVILTDRKMRAAHEASAYADSLPSPAQDAAEDDEPEEYEDPGKVERQKELEAYRRLLREEFGVDQTGTVIHGE